jgi:spore coat protein U-like protein
MKHALVLFGVAAALLFTAAPARADCSVKSTRIAFPAYDVYGAAPSDAVGELHYTCAANQKDVTPTIRITFGPSQAGSFERTMAYDGELLSYRLYQDELRTVEWGDGSAGTLAYVAACCAVGKFATLNVYARIAPGQDVSAGNYVGSLMLSIEF